ncbi:hypothetical protein [Paraflavitalea soli]|uniref:hypothetical protein n=1 Tax=Paraflavitalea soli TaxID=2315862 RepID=UPI0013C434CF|nr:hypothetical protein [Paraflavitalea soli]
MKKGCLYILFFILLLNDTSLNQFVKLPVMLAHFTEHRQRDSQIGFIQFLAMHYWGTDLNDNDNDRDAQLPYKKVDIHSIDHPVIPTIRPVIEKHLVLSSVVVQPVFNNDLLPQPALGSLFRPPKIAV